MSTTTRPRRKAPRAGSSGYWHDVKRPLTILAFLIIPILAYELGLALVLRSEHGVLTNKAHETLLQFFASVGVSAEGSLYLGGIVIIVVLLLWHLLNRDPWKVEPSTLLFMLVESLLLTLPLLVLGQLIARSSMPAFAGTALDSSSIADLGTSAKLAISIGAGLYEELGFRMMLIAALHLLLVDMLKASNTLGFVIAVIVSAAAFTWYHDLSSPAGGVSVQRLLFYFAAGLYFGAVFALRGFGIVVAVHAIYDVITILLME